MDLLRKKFTSVCILFLLVFNSTVYAAVPKHVDVVIIGAGLSGLTVAHEMKKQGLSYHLLEANDRVGGRVRTVHYSAEPSAHLKDELYADAGMEEYWQDNPAIQLIKELGLEVQTDQSVSSIMIDGKVWPFVGDREREPFLRQVLGDDGYKELSDFEFRIRPLLRSIAKGAPLPQSTLKLKDISLKDFVGRMLANHKASDWIRVTLEVEVGTTWDKISALDGLKEYHKFFKDFTNVHVKGGNSKFTESLAKAVGEENISTDMRVSRVVISPKSNQVHYVNTRSNNFNVITGKYIVNTAPLHKIADIQFDKPLPKEKWDAIKSMGWGTYLKVHVFVSPEAKKYWTVNGESFLPLLTDTFLGAIYYGAAPRDDENNILTLLIFGEPAERLSDASLDQVRSEVQDSFEKLWPGFSPYIKGMEFYRYGTESIAAWPVGRSRFDELSEALRKPFGPIYFAGDMTESSHSDGAVSSGLRVSKQIHCNELLMKKEKK